MKNFAKRLIFALISAAQISSIFLIAYIVTTLLIDNYKLLESFTDRLILRPIYLRLGIAFAVLLGYIGWLLAHKYTEIGKLKQDPYSYKYKIFYFCISLLFAGFYIDPLEKENSFIFWGVYLLLICVFYTFIPKIVFFYAHWNFLGLSYWRSRTKEHAYEHTKLEYLLLFSSVLIVCLGVFSIILTTGRYIRGKITYENYLRESTHITEVVPARTTNAERVTLVGYNFGWRTSEDKRFALYVGDEKIEQIEVWQDTIITFTLPLHIDPGYKKIWIRLPQDMFSDKSKTIQSNQMDIEIVPRLSYAPSEFDSTQTKILKRINVKYQSIKSTLKRIFYEE